jgi:glycosyltransferase involved in cell wall biosynthesis
MVAEPAPAGARYLGALKRPELLREFQRSALLLLPTTFDFSPNVVAEAAAVGLPVVASDVGGIRDVVTDGITGRLLDAAASAEEWSTVVRALLADDQGRMQMGENARKWAEGHLAFDDFRENVRTMLLKTLSEADR